MLARRNLESRADLRAGAGAPWLTEGMAGAIGLLCIAETEGIEALSQVMTRYGDAATRGLATSPVPVKALATALPRGWAAHYAPLATLGWMLQQTPSDIASLLEAVRRHGDTETALTAQAGPAVAGALLGPPRASRLVLDRAGEPWRIAATRARWQDGQWQPTASDMPFLLLARRGHALYYAQTTEIAVGAATDSVALLFDLWPSYPRSPLQDLVLEVGRAGPAWRAVMGADGAAEDVTVPVRLRP
jgi:hypothetical protein